MSLPRPVRWILYPVASVVVLTAILVAFLAFVRIDINLTPWKGPAEKAVSLALGRPISIEGNVSVSTSLWPRFRVSGVRLGNIDGFSGDYATLSRAELEVGVLPLLAFKLHVRNFDVQGITLDLQEKADGSVNWAMPEKDSREQKEHSNSSLEANVAVASDSLVVERLNLQDIRMTFTGSKRSKPRVFVIGRCSGKALPDEPFVLDMQGSMGKFPFTLNVKGASLGQLLHEKKTWLTTTMTIAKTEFGLDGMVDLSKALRSLGVRVLVKGDKLQSLNGLTGLTLPEIKDYLASAEFRLQKGRYFMRNFKIHVARSELTGNMEVNLLGDKPVATMSFTAPQVHIEDFYVPKGANATRAPATGEGAQNKKSKEKKACGGVNFTLNPDDLKKADASFELKVKEVWSHQDKLGSGTLKLTLKDGRIALEPLSVRLPGGSFLLKSSLKPGHDRASATLRLLVENFDFGVWARMYQPETTMGGTLSIDMDLSAKAGNLRKLLAGANGYLDFSVTPKNFKAGIIDLWAVNLFSAIANKGAKGSMVNYGVVRLGMHDGVLKPDLFAIDTSKIRICAHGQADFRKRRVDLVVGPTAKRPEFFSLATPFEVHGEFDDLEIGVSKGEVAGTLINFLLSPLTTPLRRMSGEIQLPEDGSDLQSIKLGPDRPSKPAPGCPGNRKASEK